MQNTRGFCARVHMAMKVRLQPLCFLLACLVVALFPLCASAEAFRILTLRHSTTSGWSEFSLNSASATVALGPVLAGQDVAGLQLTPVRIERADLYDVTPVTAECQVLIDPAVTDLTLHSTKSRRSQTSAFMLANTDPPHQFTNSSRNPVDFSITAAMLATLPVVDFAPRPVPGRAMRCCTMLLDTMSDWSAITVQSDVPLTPVFRRIVQGQDVPGLSATFQGVYKQAMDASRVVAEYGLYYDALPHYLIVNSTKGCLDDTTFTLSAGTQTATRVHPGCGPWAFSFSELPFGEPAAADFSTPLFPPTVLAFYYPWYGSPSGPEGQIMHWDQGYTDTPALGQYSSRASSTLAAHANWLGQSLVDVAIASWWGADGYTDMTLRDYAMPYFVGRSTRWALYMEEADTTASLLAQLQSAFAHCAAHPAYYCVNGRPLFFFYMRIVNQFTPAQFAGVFTQLRASGMDGFYVADSMDPAYLAAFDGLHTYDPIWLLLNEASTWPVRYQSLWLTCRLQSKIFMATVLPGYDDSHLTPPRTDPVVYPRNSGAVYQEMWQQAVLAGAEWIGICSFNEFHEGSEIEPSEQYSDAYIQSTHDFAAAFKGHAGIRDWQLFEAPGPPPRF